MLRVDFIRTTTFRWTVVVAGMFAIFIVLLFAVVYWRTERYLATRADGVITVQAQTLVSAPPQQWLGVLNQFVQQNPLAVEYAGLFTSDGKRISGNLEQVPADLQIDGPAQRSQFTVGPGGAQEVVQGIARRLPNGNVVVVGRKTIDIAEIVAETLALGIIPALCLIPLP